ncbi:Rv3654c family TadE-like protein [Kitasatospora sp. NPDC059973]|uniref:Rv3654c family TadE-like protein n=1 Tax=Kitasatospora sp. NPDC059973 TaxID=3347020 RepID=UPI0036B20A2D
MALLIPGAAVMGRVARARGARAAVGRPTDGGSATVWLVAFAVLGCTTFAAVLSVGAVVGARHRAESAADLAALAAADRLLLDLDGGCARAAGIARAQAAALVSCTVDREADAVEVVAEVSIGRLPVDLPIGPARARSRAGPIRAAAAATAAAADEGVSATAGGS